jgi:hypothetical protein
VPRQITGKSLRLPVTRSGHKILSLRGLSTLQEDVVVRIGAGLYLDGGSNPEAMPANRAESSLHLPLTAAKPGAPYHFLVLRIYIAAYAKLYRRSRGCQEKHFCGQAPATVTTPRPEHSCPGQPGSLLRGPFLVMASFPRCGDLRVDLFHRKLI